MSVHRRRRVFAALISNGGIYTTGVIGRLSADVAMRVGLPEGVREVSASVTDGIHLSLSRGFAGDAKFASMHLASVIAEPSHYCPLNKAKRRFALAGLVEDERALHVALKWVPAESAQTGLDEIWVVTAHPLGRNTWQRYCRNGRLRALAV
ncbi:MAG TPA: hypothetical protein VEA99_03655 [Gemmatimonadaceae bacterium]|nr:hypothetical protein [Gemmatimonadaceae bacterium]